MRYTATGAIRVSPSELKTADICLRKYYYNYIKEIKLDRQYNFGFALGVILHRALELYFTHKTDNNLVKTCWEDIKNTAKELWVTNEEFNNLSEDIVVKRINSLFKEIKSAIDINKNKIIGVEEHLSAPLDKFHELHGFIDIRYEGEDGKLKLADWKFGKNIKNETSVLEYWYQFVGYRFLHETIFGTIPEIVMHTGSISLAEAPKQSFKYAQIKIELPFDKLIKDLHTRAIALTEFVLRSGNDVESCKEKFPHTGRSSGVCSYCEYNDICNGSMPEPESSKSKIIEVISNATETNTKNSPMEEC